MGIYLADRRRTWSSISQSPSRPLSSPEGIGWTKARFLSCPVEDVRVQPMQVKTSGIKTASGVIPHCATCGGSRLLPVSSAPPLALCLTLEESIVGEQLKMLSYVDYALAVRLHSVADSVDCFCEAIQVDLCAIEHVASIILKVRVNLELARHWEMCNTSDPPQMGARFYHE